MRKKLSLSILSVILSGELLLFMALSLLAYKIEYIWIAVAAVWIGVAVSIYCFCRKLKDFYLRREEKQRTRENEGSEKIYQICNTIIDIVKKSNEDLSDHLTSLAGIQKKIIEDNGILCHKLEESVNEICKENGLRINEIKESIVNLNGILSTNSAENKNQLAGMTKLFENDSRILGDITGIVRDIKDTDSQHIDEMNKRFVEHSSQMSDDHNKKIDQLTCELKKGIDSMNDHYMHTMEEMSRRHAVQIEQWSINTEAIVTSTQDAINVMISNVDEHLTGQSVESRRVINESIKDSQKSIAGIVDKTQDVMQKQYKMLNELNYSVISGIQGLLEEKLSELIEQERNTRDMLNGSTDQYCQQLSKSVIGFTNESASKMITGCERILNDALEHIVEVSENINEKHSVAFGHYMNDLEKVYNETIGSHIKTLEEQVKNRISEFVAENKTALDKNNELAYELLSTEKNFITEFEGNNAKLRQTIQNAFEEYSKSVEGNIIQFKDTVTENIAETDNNAREYIGDFARKSDKMIETLAEKLRDYSEGFVGQSAQAIANVQADNNAKIQELCENVSMYAQENSEFIIHCKEANDAVADSVHDMIRDRQELIHKMKVISGEHIESLNTTLRTHIIDMNEMLQEVNTENSNAFSASMAGYRDKFVEANAEAIAEVQKDNVDSITEANKKISELADGMKKFREDVTSVLTMMENDIREGLEKQADNSDSFHDSINTLFDEKLNDYDGKFDKYNEIFNDLSSRIQVVIAACENNTSKYDETLKFILSSQKEANALSNKDIELLRSFMKR